MLQSNELKLHLPAHAKCELFLRDGVWELQQQTVSLLLLTCRDLGLDGIRRDDTAVPASRREMMP